MSGALKAKHSGRDAGLRVGRNVVIARKDRWIQIVSDVKAQRPDGRLITHAHTDCMREVVVTALQMRALVDADVRVGLMPAQQALDHFLGPREHVPHIVKDGKSDTVIQVRDGDVGEAQFEIIQEHRTASERKSGKGITRPRLV